MSYMYILTLLQQLFVFLIVSGTSILSELDVISDVVDPDISSTQPTQHPQTVQIRYYHQLQVAQPGPSGVVAPLEPVSNLPAHSYQADPSMLQSDPTAHAQYVRDLTQGFQEIPEPSVPLNQQSHSSLRGYMPQGRIEDEPPNWRDSLPTATLLPLLPSHYDPAQDIQQDPQDEPYQNQWCAQGQTTYWYHSYPDDHSTTSVPQGNSQTTTQMSAHQNPYHQYGSLAQQHYSPQVHMTQSRPGDVGLNDNQTWSGNSRLLPIDLSRSNDHTHGRSQRADLTRQFYHGQQYQQYAHTSQHIDVQHSTTAPTQETARKAKGTHLCECVGDCTYKDIPLTTRDYKNHMQAMKDQKRNKECYGFVKLYLQGVEQKFPCPFRASTNTELDCHMKSRHLTCTQVRCDNPGPHQPEPQQSKQHPPAEPHQPAKPHHRMTGLVIHIFEKHYVFDQDERPPQINKDFIKKLNYKQVNYLKEQHRIFKCKNTCLTFNVQAKNIETHQYSCMQPEINEDEKSSCEQPKTLDKPFKCEFKQWNGKEWEQCKKKPTGYGGAGSLYKHYTRKHKAECYFRFAVSYKCGLVENYIKTKNAAAKCLLCDGSVGENDHLHVPIPTFTTINKWDNEFAKAFANESHSTHWRAVLNAKYDKKEDWKFHPYVIGNVKEKCMRPVFPKGIAPIQRSLSIQAADGNEKQ